LFLQALLVHQVKEMLVAVALALVNLMPQEAVAVHQPQDKQEVTG
jgi:hypothetical protein